MYMLSIHCDDGELEVFHHPIAEDRIAEVVKIVIAPRQGDDPLDEYRAKGWISQKTCNKIVKARAAEAHSTSSEGEG